MKALVLAEKPSVGKELARVLNCQKTTKGYCEGAEYVVTWALGHLVTLAEPHVYDQKLKEWRMEDLPMLPEKMKLQVIRQSSHQFKIVSGLMQRDDIGELIIATDAGREGELVARWIMKLAKWKKPFQRLWISSQTDEAIRVGFASLKPGAAYDNLYHSAVCRSEADWLIGLNVTRALTCKFNSSLNAGRVQTPTLAMVVNREKEIKHFTPVDYWTLSVDFGDYFGAWRDPHGNGRFSDYQRVKALAAAMEGQTGVIADVAVKEKADPPPLAYDLTELQRDANRQYGLSAHKTLATLQNLYERYKVVTYPRTDSRYITTDMVATLPRRLQSVAVGPYGRLVEPLWQKPLAPGKRFVDDSKVSDHHAIIPTEEPPKLLAFTTDEKNVYDLIVKRFIAVLYPPYRYDQTTLVTVVNVEKFYSQGRIVKDLGWRAVTTKLVDEGDAEEGLPEQTLSQQTTGTAKPVKKCVIQQAKTKPPVQYTEATLLTAMESPGKFIADEELRESIKTGGLGTPATRAEIIEKLLSNEYLERNGKSLLPTSKAFQLLELVPPELRLPELTAQWELRLSKIAQGAETPEGFMADIRQNAVDLVHSVRASTAAYHPPEESQKEVFELGKRSKKELQMNKRLIKQYSDHANTSTSLGDLLKAALDKKGA